MTSGSKEVVIAHGSSRGRRRLDGDSAVQSLAFQRGFAHAFGVEEADSVVRARRRLLSLLVGGGAAGEDSLRERRGMLGWVTVYDRGAPSSSSSASSGPVSESSTVSPSSACPRRRRRRLRRRFYRHREMCRHKVHFYRRLGVFKGDEDAVDDLISERVVVSYQR